MKVYFDQDGDITQDFVCCGGRMKVPRPPKNWEIVANDGEIYYSRGFHKWRGGLVVPGTKDNDYDSLFKWKEEILKDKGNKPIKLLAVDW